MNEHGKKMCPRCTRLALKGWEELTDEERIFANSLPMSAEYPLALRKRHRFCTFCWFESAAGDEIDRV